VSVAGREVACVVSRKLRRDDAECISLIEVVPHELSRPPAQGTEHYAGAVIKEVPGGTLLTTHHEVTLGSLGQGIKLPLGVRNLAARMKRQCEMEAGTQSRLVEFVNHWIVLSLLALFSFWYLLGWQDALLIAVVVVLHELGHAAAMRMVGIPVHGIYLIPFFGGVAVPKTAYRSQGPARLHRAHGRGLQLGPDTGARGALLRDRGGVGAACRADLRPHQRPQPVAHLSAGRRPRPERPARLVQPPLGTRRQLGRLLTGAAVGFYLHPLLLGLPLLVFALGLYLSSGWTGEMKRLSLLGGTGLTLAFATTFAVYLVTFLFADNAKAVLDGRESIAPLQAWLPVPLRCGLPPSSADILDRYLDERGERDGLTLMLTLAWADRAGHRAVVQRRLDGQDGIRATHYINFARQERVGLWLDLAKSGALADINAEIAWARSHASVLRHILATALVVHGRTRGRGATCSWVLATRQRSCNASCARRSIWTIG
jgi:hypothetical protein